MIKVVRQAFGFCAFMLYIADTVSAECTKTLKVGVNEHWPPFVYLQDNTLTGIEIDISNLVLQQAGYCVSFIQLPSSNRAFNELQKGTIDIVFAASYTKERAEYAFFSKGYRIETMRLFGNASAGAAARSNSRLTFGENLIAVNRGSYYGEKFAALITHSKNRLVPVAHMVQRINMVRLGRVHYMVEDEVAGLYLIKNKGYDDIFMHPYIVHENAVSFMLSKTTLSKADKTKIDTAIASNKKTIDLIVKKYVS